MFKRTKNPIGSLENQINQLKNPLRAYIDSTDGHLVQWRQRKDRCLRKLSDIEQAAKAKNPTDSELLEWVTQQEQVIQQQVNKYKELMESIGKVIKFSKISDVPEADRNTLALLVKKDSTNPMYSDTPALLIDLNAFKNTMEMLEDAYASKDRDVKAEAAKQKKEESTSGDSMKTEERDAERAADPQASEAALRFETPQEEKEEQLEVHSPRQQEVLPDISGGGEESLVPLSEEKEKQPRGVIGFDVEQKREKTQFEEHLMQVPTEESAAPAEEDEQQKRERELKIAQAKRELKQAVDEVEERVRKTKQFLGRFKKAFKLLERDQTRFPDVESYLNDFLVQQKFLEKGQQYELIKEEFPGVDVLREVVGRDQIANDEEYKSTFIKAKQILANNELDQLREQLADFASKLTNPSAGVVVAPIEQPQQQGERLDLGGQEGRSPLPRHEQQLSPQLRQKSKEPEPIPGSGSQAGIGFEPIELKSRQQGGQPGQEQQPQLEPELTPEMKSHQDLLGEMYYHQQQLVSALGGKNLELVIYHAISLNRLMKKVDTNICPQDELLNKLRINIDADTDAVSYRHELMKGLSKLPPEKYDTQGLQEVLNLFDSKPDRSTVQSVAGAIAIPLFALPQNFEGVNLDNRLIEYHMKNTPIDKIRKELKKDGLFKEKTFRTYQLDHISEIMEQQFQLQPNAAFHLLQEIKQEIIDRDWKLAKDNKGKKFTIDYPSGTSKDIRLPPDARKIFEAIVKANMKAQQEKVPEKKQEIYKKALNEVIKIGNNAAKPKKSHGFWGKALPVRDESFFNHFKKAYEYKQQQELEKKQKKSRHSRTQ